MHAPRTLHALGSELPPNTSGSTCREAGSPRASSAALNDMGFGMRAADLLVLGKLPTKVLTSAAVGERERFLGPRAGLNIPPQLCGCKE